MRELAIALLNDDNGINETAYGLLREMMVKSGDCEDIIRAVDATDGRFYLPSGF